MALEEGLCERPGARGSEGGNGKMLRTTSGVLAAMVLVSAPANLLAAGEQPTPVSILFDSRHLDRIDKGGEVTYRFERKVSDEKLLGPAFTDDIKLDVTKINEKGERDVAFQVFTGERARDLTNWPELTINPIFIWYLDRAVGNFGQLAGGSQPYLKGRFREALREKAEVQTIKFSYNGKDVDAYRVTVQPYAGDENARRMQGFEGSRFTLVVSNEVPGYFLDMVASFESTTATFPRLEEHISLVGMGETK
jgi:hypothetical protein